MKTSIMILLIVLTTLVIQDAVHAGQGEDAEGGSRPPWGGPAGLSSLLSRLLSRKERKAHEGFIGGGGRKKYPWAE